MEYQIAFLASCDIDDLEVIDTEDVFDAIDKSGFPHFIFSEFMSPAKSKQTLNDLANRLMDAGFNIALPTIEEREAHPQLAFAIRRMNGDDVLEAKKQYLRYQFGRLQNRVANMTLEAFASRHTVQELSLLTDNTEGFLMYLQDDNGGDEICSMDHFVRALRGDRDIYVAAHICELSKEG